MSDTPHQPDVDLTDTEEEMDCAPDVVEVLENAVKDILALPSAGNLSLRIQCLASLNTMINRWKAEIKDTPLPRLIQPSVNEERPRVTVVKSPHGFSVKSTAPVSKSDSNKRTRL